jgi:hypothetical protein
MTQEEYLYKMELLMLEQSDIEHHLRHNEKHGKFEWLASNPCETRTPYELMQVEYIHVSKQIAELENEYLN